MAVKELLQQQQQFFCAISLRHLQLAFFCLVFGIVWSTLQFFFTFLFFPPRTAKTFTGGFPLAITQQNFLLFFMAAAEEEEEEEEDGK